MKKSKFSLAREDEELVLLVNGTDHITVALWALDYAERVKPYFEEKLPAGSSPAPRN